eukprot:16451103-Heterocapsa_arctica.AAC.1
MTRPPGRDGSPSKPGAKATAKAKATAEAGKPGNGVNWCRKFLAAEGCPKSAAECNYPHLDESSVNCIKALQARAKAKAKAKALAAQG